MIVSNPSYVFGGTGKVPKSYTGSKNELSSGMCYMAPIAPYA